MRFLWLDYNESYEKLIEPWMEDADTRKYASDHSWHDEYQYYIDSAEYCLNKNFFCKVVFDDTKIIAALILIGYEDSLTFNPIIINPDYRGKGYCTLIVKEFLNNLNKIIPYKYSVIKAGIDLSNKASIKAFINNGFVLDRVHPDFNFGYYQFII